MERLRILSFVLLTVCYSATMAASEDDLFRNVRKIRSTLLVEAVLERNPNLPAMRSAWDSAEARIVQAESLDDPMLSYTVAPQTVGNANMDAGQKLSLSMRFPWLGKRGLRGDAARFEADAVKAGIEEMRLKLIEMAKNAYSDWYYVYSAIRINKINKSLLREFRDIAEIKYAAGTASKQDVLHAEVEYALLEHQDILLERWRREVQVILNTLLQRQPNQTIPPPDNFSEPTPLPDVEQLHSSALEAHPELRSIDAHIHASRSRVDLARREYYPDVKLSTAYNSLWNQNEKRLSVGIGINIPIQGKRHAAEDEAQAELIQLELERQAKEAEVLGEVQQVYDRIIESKHILALYRDRLIPLAEENIEVARTDYQVDQGSFLDLINAEKNLMQTRLRSERALADYHSHIAVLELVTGGADAFSSVEGVEP